MRFRAYSILEAAIPNHVAAALAALLMNLPLAAGAGLVPKLNVCTVTINSTEEAQAFRENLNPEDFRFTELTELGSTKNADSWLGEACESGVSCDVLVISGHFGDGAFWDENSLQLTLEQLEKASCSEQCDGIFAKPVEIFLFGCNTLANKNRDQRSNAEYYRVLIDHLQFSPSQAAEAVVERYGPLNRSAAERFQQIFGQTEHIYGFNSISPLGSQVRPYLEWYLRGKGDYADWIRTERVTRAEKWLAAITGKPVKPLEANRDFADAMFVTNQAQCFGAERDPELDRKRDYLDLACRLADEKANLAHLKTISGLTGSPQQFLRYYDLVWPMIEEASDKPSIIKHPKRPAARELAGIKAGIRAHLGEYPELLIYPTVTAEFATDLFAAEVITQDERRAMVDEALRLALKSPVSPEIATLICTNIWNFIPPLVSRLDIGALRLASESDTELQRALSCLEQVGAGI